MYESVTILAFTQDGLLEIKIAGRSYSSGLQSTGMFLEMDGDGFSIWNSTFAGNGGPYTIAGEIIGSNNIFLNKVPASFITDPRTLTITADGNLVLVDAFKRIRWTALASVPGAGLSPFVLEITDAGVATLVDGNDNGSAPLSPKSTTCGKSPLGVDTYCTADACCSKFSKCGTDAQHCNGGGQSGACNKKPSYTNSDSDNVMVQGTGLWSWDGNYHFDIAQDGRLTVSHTCPTAFFPFVSTTKSLIKPARMIIKSNGSIAFMDAQYKQNTVDYYKDIARNHPGPFHVKVDNDGKS
ncbi:hypothetical protein HDU88_006519 [Geranomyces variabilis]|nr:hypothetical protein HDU88_006519 [Geranomyces variabilis]